MIDSVVPPSTIAQQDRDIRAWAFLAPDVAAEHAPPSADGSLSGLRFGVKDVMDVSGMPTCHGAALKDVQPARFDAACVAILRRAGAVPLGKTVTAEFAVSAPGPTRNPWQLEHTPGGSSSGSAAAVAAGMVPLCIGTQTGGSIIRPAAFNGVVGFKPGFGRVPRTGMQVLCDTLDTIGWFTTDVSLSKRVAELFMADIEPAYEEGRRLRIAVLPADEIGELSADAKQSLERAAQALTAHGASVEQPEAGELFCQALTLHAGIMQYELARGLLPVLHGEPEALRPQTLAVIEAGLAITAQEYVRLQKQRQQLHAEWLLRLSEYDLILTPSAPGTAPHGHSSTGSSVFNRTWSLLGWPCVHLPTGFGENGLPIGVQLVGRAGADLRLLSLAEALHPVLDRRTHRAPKPEAA